MSISLNDHESRIGVLEKAKANQMTITTLLPRDTRHGTYTLRDNIANWDFIIMFFDTGPGTNIYTPAVVPSKICQTDGRSLSFMCTGSDWGTSYKFPTDTSITIFASRSPSYSTIYGLKIYYIFRYNIWKYSKLISLILKEV